MKCVFVTVGTTSFDDLIACVSAHDSLQIIQSLGYNRLVLQIGRGKVVPEPFSTESFTLDVYRYKDSLKEDLQKADLVISHAGAGSCLETLEKRKPLIVVINERLMNNHQLELAKQLHKDGISSTVPAGILKTDYLTSCLNSFLAILTCLPNQPVSLTSYFLPLSKHFEFLTSKTCSFVFYFDCDLCVVFLSVSMLISLHVNI
uniref:UDP-N-acetylglucosamine transferase subunit ALG13 n=1 Tax=Bos mutus grunniens TaxID=30521 RepID=A0A8B9YLF1_BOSMU